MGNYRWIATQLTNSTADVDQWIELGAGDGGLSRYLESKRHRVTAIDLAPKPVHWPEGWDWLQQDLFAALPDLIGSQSCGIVASLFLHHLDGAELQKLGSLLTENAAHIIVAEPSRDRLIWLLSHCFFPFINSVTRHDMVVSIEAGFRGGDLAQLLSLGSDWRIEFGTTLLGAYRFEAWRQN
ncbi:MAG: hypothetical protein AAF236_00215 [Verrucomicrobiota bacterium]